MVRLFVAVWLCALASFGLAAFDLQFVNKYNPSVNTSSGFSKIVRDNSGGYYAAGKAGYDLLLVRFDQFGSITHTRVWDTPAVYADSPVRVDITDSGDVVVVVAAGVLRYIARFTESLIPMWYLQMPGSATAATNLAGVTCYVTPSTSPGMSTAQIVTAAGSLSGSVSLAAGAVMVVEPCNSAANPGFIIAGNRSDQTFVARITNSAGGVYNSITSAPTASSLNRVYAAAVDSSGIVSAAAILQSGSDSFLSLIRVSSTGTITRSSSFGFVDSIRKVVIASSTVARVVLELGSTDRILEFNRTTFANLRQYDAESIRDFGYLSTTNELISASDNNRYYAFEIGSSSISSGSTWDTVAAATIGTDQVVAVGSENNIATVVWHTAQGAAEASFQFPGPTVRELADSDLNAAGLLTLAMNQNFPDAGTIVSYRANGTVAFAKGFHASSRAQVHRVITLPDGSVFAAGRVKGLTFDTLAACLYSPTGALVFAKTYGGTGVDEVVSVAYVPGAGYYILATNFDEDMALIRIGGNGTAFWSQPLGTNIMAASDLVVTPQNNLAVVLSTQPGAEVRLLSSGSGDQLQSVQLNASLNWDKVGLALAPGGALVAMRTREASEQTVLTKLNGTTLAELASYGDTALTASFDVGTNGRVALLQSNAGVLRLRQLTPELVTPIDSALDTNLRDLNDVAVGPTGLVYIAANELNGTTINAYAAKYLTNGVRSAVRRLSGETKEVFAPTGTVWITGTTPTRAKGDNPYAAKYTP